MINITLHINEKLEIRTYSSPVLLSDVLCDAGLFLRHPCGRKGICGKCRIKAAGALSPISGTEQSMLSNEDKHQNIRLACLCKAIGDCDIYYTTSAQKMQGVTEGFMTDFVKKPIVDTGLGCAVDIGTTTIAAYLYSMMDCTLISSLCVSNPQSKFGSDVISRIEAYPENKDALKKCICDKLKFIINSFGVSPDVWVITGNTTMLHLLCGLDPSDIAIAPFVAKDLFGRWENNVYLPRCISAYVGADITCAALSCGLTDNDKSLLVDVGTNGEMALYAAGKLLCCSTAAGPAFEGVGIEMGMSAEVGAISHVYIEDGTLIYETVDSAPAVGICGTGLIDAVACMLTLGIIDDTGYLEEDFYIADSSVRITPADVRNLQLAKAAVCAGIDTLLHHCDITEDEVEHFYIAGGFGRYLNTESCARIGLFPEKLAAIAKPVGNAAGAGASIILQSKDKLTLSEKLAEEAEAVELSESPYFMERYVENMMFRGASK